MNRTDALVTQRRGSNRSQRGTALIEFALVFPFFLVFTFAVVDLARAFFIKNILHQAAREGVRTLVVKTMADSSDAGARVAQVLAAGNVPVKSVLYLGPVSGQMGVRVQSEMSWLFSGLYAWTGATFPKTIDLSAEAWMRKETP